MVSYITPSTTKSDISLGAGCLSECPGGSGGNHRSKPLYFGFELAPGSQREKETGFTSGSHTLTDPHQQNHLYSYLIRFGKGEGLNICFVVERVT